MARKSAFEHILKVLEYAEAVKRALAIAMATGDITQIKNELNLLQTAIVAGLEHSEKAESEVLKATFTKATQLVNKAIQAVDKKDFREAATAIDDIISIEKATEEEEILLYRGINQPDLKGRIGAWWTTNPYYALRFSGRKQMFVALVTKTELDALAEDVSIEENLQNYFFGKQDPVNTRQVTSEEITELEAHATFSKPEPSKPGERPPPGGTMMKPPENFIQVGEKIFKKTFKIL